MDVLIICSILNLITSITNTFIITVCSPIYIICVTDDNYIEGSKRAMAVGLRLTCIVLVISDTILNCGYFMYI